MSNPYYIIENTSGEQDRSIIVYGGKLRDGGPTRPYRKVLHFDNDVSEDPDNTREYAVMQGPPITANELTIGFWIYPKGVSTPGSGVVINRKNGESHGVIINSNGKEYLMGYVWGNPAHNFEFDLNVQIPTDQWTYIVVIIYSTGIAKLFGNNKYLGVHDMGFVRDPVVLDNIELGRFSGMLDDVSLYPTALEYGSVTLGSTARSEVAWLYNKSRLTGEVHTEIIGPEHESSPFYYIQDKEYVTAHNNYIVNRGMYEESSDPASDSNMLDETFAISGGPNDGTYAIANGSFRTFPGKILDKPKDLSNKEEKEND